MPQGMQDLSSLTRERTCAPEVEVQSPNHWITRDLLVNLFVMPLLILNFCTCVSLFGLFSYPFDHLSVFGRYHIILIIRCERVLIAHWVNTPYFKIGLTGFHFFLFHVSLGSTC